MKNAKSATSSKPNRPTLKTGQAVKGPDFFGCFNTGMAPKIVRSKILLDWASLNKKGYRFVVGPDLYTRDATLDLLYGKVKGATWKLDRRIVKFFKTSAAAWKYFDGLAAEIVESNRKDAAEAKSLRSRANAGDIGAALAYGDLAGL